MAALQTEREPRVARSSAGGRVPPHDLQAEESLLGAMMLSKDAIAAASEIIGGPDDFYKPAHGHIYEAIIGLYGTGEPVDPVTVADALTRVDLLEAIGGTGVLVNLQSRTPATTSAGRYAKIVEEHALLRRMIWVSSEIIEGAYSVPDDVDGLIDDAEARMYAVAERRLTDTTAPIGDLLNLTLDRLEELYNRGETITGTPTGYVDLDKLLAGLQPSSLVVVGARPAMGKTSFALGIASHAAMKAQRPTLLFSLEMSQLELSQRILCAEARVDATKVRNGTLSTAEWEKIHHAVGRLAGAPIFIDDNPNLTIMDIRAKARRLKARLGDLGCIIIDYIQLMNGRMRAENRQVEISEISRNLKILARELECPVVACAQLNRQLETRADKRPMLSDLRESGALEQDSDVVLFLYRDEVYNPETPDRGQAEVIVAKHRAGPTRTIRLAWIENNTRFDNMARGM